MMKPVVGRLPPISRCCLPALRLLRHQSSSSSWALHLQNPEYVISRSSSDTDLGLRSNLVPDSVPPPNAQSSGHEPDKEPISDQEWELRTGRAIDVLQDTLPQFFSAGLVTSIDKATGKPRPSSYIHIPMTKANPLDFRTVNEEVETIYSPKVRLSYTPPVALPAPFPQTFHIEGLPLYLASSVFIRHTLNTLYSDLKVSLKRVTLQGPSSGTDNPQGTPSTKAQTSRGSREKSMLVILTASGIARVSGSPGQWEVNSTYTFSPLTGLIHVHTINSIHPAPHQAVYDTLRTSLGKVFGFGLAGEGAGGTRTGGAGAGSTICDNR